MVSSLTEHGAETTLRALELGAIDFVTKPKIDVEATDRVICLGASTGGTEALREVICAMGPDSPGVVIVQHMPEKFTQQFAARLDKLCALARAA